MSLARAWKVKAHAYREEVRQCSALISDLHAAVDKAVETQQERDTWKRRAEEATEHARSEYDRGRRKGRADVGKYANAIGRIKGALGLAGAIPMDETVKAVGSLAKRLNEAQAACAALVAMVRGYAGLSSTPELSLIAATCRAALAQLPAAVRRYVAEVEALREVARTAIHFYAMVKGECPSLLDDDHNADDFAAALAHLDAVRAENGKP